MHKSKYKTQKSNNSGLYEVLLKGTPKAPISVDKQRLVEFHYYVALNLKNC